MKMLQGKISLITGASRGIGKGIAIAFAKQGADVAFTYRSSDESAKALEKELKSYGVRAKAYKSDAGDYAAAEALIASVLEDFGGLEVVVNNAGITKDGLILRMDDKQWQAVMDTNLNSVFNITKHAARPLMRSRKGSIINMSSVVGRNGNAGQSNYAASKAGINGFTQSIAKELGSRNIRCNAIAPGFIQTEMTETLDPKVVEQWSELIPLKRPGTVEDVANLTVFLASDMSSYLTGQVIDCSGGMWM